MALDRRFKARRFSVLYEQHLPAVARFVARRLASAEVGDVVAETFTVAWRRFDDIPAPPTTLPWLYGVANGILANQHRGDRRRRALSERLRNEWVTRPVRSDVHLSAETSALASVLELLSESDRSLLMLSAWEELTPAELAVVLDVDVTVVRNRLTRARRRFRAHLVAAGLLTQDRASGEITGTERS